MKTETDRKEGSGTMSRPLFSIVIPTYNRAHTVTTAVASCLAQTCRDFEIIVVDDDKSTDDIASALARFDGAQIRLVARHQGRAAAARNAGARLARGRFVAFLDADDAWLPDKLERCRRHLETAPGDLVYSQTYVDRGVGRLWVKPARGLRRNEDIYDYLFAHKGWVHPSTVVVDADLARANPFREDLSFGDDTQFAIDMWRRGVPITMIDAPLAVYEDRFEPGRLSQSPVFEAADTPEHESFIAWVESQKPYMSAEAFAGCRAFFLSRFVARSSPRQALQFIFDGYRVGVVDAGKALSQLVQTFAPSLYRRCADAVARRAGCPPPAAVTRLHDPRRLLEAGGG